MNEKLEGMENRWIVAYFRALHRHILGGTDENQ
jgi:hypothetical protein